MGASTASVQITQKHRLGKWPEVGDIAERLPHLLRAQGGAVAPYTATMAMLSVRIPGHPVTCSDDIRSGVPKYPVTPSPCR